MIVLDTNVLSELLRPAPHAGVVAWLAGQPRAALFTTTVIRAEILYGVRVLSDGARFVAEAASGCRSARNGAATDVRVFSASMRRGCEGVLHAPAYGRKISPDTVGAHGKRG